MFHDIIESVKRSSVPTEDSILSKSHAYNHNIKNLWPRSEERWSSWTVQSSKTLELGIHANVIHVKYYKEHSFFNMWNISYEYKLFWYEVI